LIRNFISLVVLSILLEWVSSIILNTESLFINSLVNEVTEQQFLEFLDFKKRWVWLGYFITPIVLFFKIIIISIVLEVGCFFFNKEIKYKAIINIVIKAEFVFLGVLLLKTIWFYVFQQEYTLEDLQNFYPLSGLNIIGYKSLQSWFIYPLQVLNLFEMAYWFILAYLLGKELKVSSNKGLAIVASSYGTSLVIWVASIMFLTLNNN